MDISQTRTTPNSALFHKVPCGNCDCNFFDDHGFCSKPPHTTFDGMAICCINDLKEERESIPRPLRHKCLLCGVDFNYGFDTPEFRKELAKNKTLVAKYFCNACMGAFSITITAPNTTETKEG